MTVQYLPWIVTGAAEPGSGCARLTMIMLAVRCSLIRAILSSTTVLATLALSAENRTKLERIVLLPRMVYGSVKRGDKLGSIEYRLNGKTVKTVPLYAAQTVDEGAKELNFFQKILGFFGIYV